MPRNMPTSPQVLGQLSLASLWGRYIEYQHVISRSGMLISITNCYMCVNFFTYKNVIFKIILEFLLVMMLLLFMLVIIM